MVEVVRFDEVVDCLVEEWWCGEEECFLDDLEGMMDKDIMRQVEKIECSALVSEGGDELMKICYLLWVAKRAESVQWMIWQQQEGDKDEMINDVCTLLQATSPSAD